MNWNWPSRKPAAKTKSARPLAALSEPLAARRGLREPGALKRDGYLKNALTYRCVWMVAEAAAPMSFMSSADRERPTRRDADGWSPILQIKSCYPADDTIGQAPPLGCVRLAAWLDGRGAARMCRIIEGYRIPSRGISMPLRST